MSEHPDLDARAREILDANRYLVLGTVEPDGEPRLSPVYFTHVDYAELYWVSAPEAHHSANLQRHPSVNIVVFDSSAPVGHGSCVYLHADAAIVPDGRVGRPLPGGVFRRPARRVRVHTRRAERR